MGTVLFFGPFHTDLQQCFQALGAFGAEVFWEKREKGFLTLLKYRQPSVVISENHAQRTQCRELTEMILTHSPLTKVIMVSEGGICPQVNLIGPRLESPCQAHHAAKGNLLHIAESLLVGELPSSSDWSPALFGRTSSPAMLQLEAMVKKIADTDATVLLRGESGVGKGVIASSLHGHSSRSECPLIRINCAALPSELLESELFGFERGAFTGAQQAKPGKFESANGGSILLDEIGELPMPMQAKLLHVLEDNQFSRLGASQDTRVDVRVLALTNRDLESAVQAGKFRKDLYYRLKVVTLVIPPLRERIEEIPWLVERFIEKFSQQYTRPKIQISPKNLTLLQSYTWPGNVRELENIIKRAVILQDSSVFEQELELNEKTSHSPNHALQLCGVGLKEVSRQAKRDAERELILKTLNHTHWNRTLTAQILQISYKTLLYKMQDAGLSRSDQEKLEPNRLV